MVDFIDLAARPSGQPVRAGVKPGTQHHGLHRRLREQEIVNEPGSYADVDGCQKKRMLQGRDGLQVGRPRRRKPHVGGCRLPSESMS